MRNASPALLVSLLLFPLQLSAETGMGLAVDHKSGKIHRLDLQDDEVIYVSPGWGTNIRNGRFSPDGSKFVTLNSAKKVEIRKLDGTVTKSFDAFAGDDGQVSWTDPVSGETEENIWVGGLGKLVRYDLDGVKKETITLKGGGSGDTAMTDAEAAETKVRFVSHNNKTAGGRPKFAASVLLDQKDSQNRAPVLKLGSGCSVGPSPDGSRLTRNLWEKAAECAATSYKTDCFHQTMKIHKRTGEQTHYIYIYDMIPQYKPANTADYIDPVKGWTFNAQTWPSNSNDLILVPAGRCYPQMAEDSSSCSTIPWIYRLSTKKATCLYPDPFAKGMWWYPTDFFSGKVGPQPDCTGAAQCNDNNPCTTDKCSSGGSCSNTPIDGCCTKASECDDGKVCTDDTCDNNACKNTTIAGCCTQASECDDGKVCTKDVCTANACQNTAISGCCTGASQCDDDNVCTNDSCDSNVCSNAAIGGCCKADADCADNSPCTKDSCKVATGECVNEPVADCCVADADCDDDDPCTADSCRDNVCSNVAIADCCHEASECGTDSACTTHSCESNLCVQSSLPNCCTTAADCNDEDDCTTDSCAAGGQCLNELIPGCEESKKPAIALTTQLEGQAFAVGDTVHITFSTTAIADVAIYRSTDGGETWPLLARIDDSSESWGSYAWELGAEDVCDKCKLRLESYFGEAPAESGLFSITSRGDRRSLLSGGCSTGGGLGSTWLFWIGLGGLAFVLLSRRRRPR